MARRISRRRFLGGTMAAAAGLAIVPSRVLGGPRAPSNLITRATIGCGSMGMGHVVGWPEQVAVCDVDRDRLARAVNRAGGKCQAVSDWRRIMDRKDVDVVHIATPPHWHALMTVASAQAGKDIYCEKPMNRFIAEGRAVLNAVRRYGRVIQHNTYGRGGWQRWRKLVASGLLGTPLTVRMSPRTGYGFKVREWSGTTTPLPPEPVPESLDYDMWLGPAPWKPYNRARIFYVFRKWWDYDGGGLTDMGQHWIDPIQYLLGKDDTGPAEVEAYASWPPHPEAVQLWGRIDLRYADGTQIILESGEWGARPIESDVFLEGPRGKVWRDGRSDPEGIWERLRAFPEPPRLVGFDEAVRTRNTLSGDHPNADEGNRSVTLLHLGNIAIRTGRKIRWDPVAEKVIGDEEANRLVNQPYRAPWHL